METTKFSERHKDFFEQVFAVVELIPYGRVTSYGSIAKYLGMARSSRMVGWAMNASHSSKRNLPAHRVVNRVGVLTGKFHFATTDEMEKKLTEEGHIIKNDKVTQFAEKFWDPMIELSI